MTNYTDLAARVLAFKSKSKDTGWLKKTLDLIRSILLSSGLSAKKIYLGQEAVTGTADVDLTTEFSAIDRVVASLATDPVATAMWVSAAKGGTTGHIDLKVWKPTSANGTASADVTPAEATTAANVNYVVIGDPA